MLLSGPPTRPSHKAKHIKGRIGGLGSDEPYPINLISPWDHGVPHNEQLATTCSLIRPEGQLVRAAPS